jgi:histidine triad (HIT) family protein
MDNCVFCAIAEKRIQPWLVMENETCLAFLDANPIAPYHTLVIPKQHCVGMLDVSADILTDVTAMMHQVCRLYQEKLGIDSFQIFNNTGPSSLQTVFHLHFHIVPRFENDAISFNVTPMPELVEKYPEMLEKLKLTS